MDQDLRRFVDFTKKWKAEPKKTTFFQDTISLLEKDFGKPLNKDESALTGDRYFDLFVKEAHPFMFALTKEASTEDLIVPEEEAVDLPYPCICIEVIGNHITIPDEREHGPKMYINAIFVRETSPKEYEFLVHTSFRMVDGKVSHVMSPISRDGSVPMDNIFNIYNGLVKSFLDRLSNEKIGSAKAGNKMKLGSGKMKRFYKQRPITIVTPKTLPLTSVDIGGQVRDIDWTHRWEVRGHWRIVKGLGKDREGNYSVSGYTWVSNHVKGPDNAPIKRKTYVVGE